MKRSFALIFVFVFVLTLAACSGNNDSPDEIYEKETTSDEAIVNEQNTFKYKSNLLREHIYAYENPDIFVEYLDDDFKYVRTTNDQILVRTEIENEDNPYKTYYKWEVFFDYGALENVQKAFVIEEDENNEEPLPAYYDVDDVLHIKVDNIWFSCPEVVGHPYQCSGFKNRDSRWGVMDRYYLMIYTYEENNPTNRYVYDELEGLIGHYTKNIWDIDTDQVFNAIDFATANYSYLDWEKHRYETTDTFVSNGILYMLESDVYEHYQVKALGRTEDIVTDLSETYILRKKDNGNTLWYYDQEMILPEWKTPGQIVDAASSDTASVVFFDDGSAYLYIHSWDGTVFSTSGPIYSEELTNLNRDGKIKDLGGSSVTIYLIMDDNATYSLDGDEVSRLDKNRQ